MSICNLCRYRRIRKRARERHMVVTLLRDAVWGMGGVNVYVHPKRIDIESLPGGEDGLRERWREVWFKELGERCTCSE